MKPLRIQSENFTVRDSHAVDVYFSEINKYRVLTPEEEVELCERIQNGDEKAKELLVIHNLRFVISVAKRYQSLGLKLGDLIAIGNIGMLRAAEKFDYSKGFKFISYAVWWIRQQIMSEIGFKGNGIKLPSNRVTIMYKISKFSDKFYTNHWREPTIVEIAEEFGLSPELIHDMMMASEDSTSLNEPAFDDSDVEIADMCVDRNELQDERIERENYFRKVVEPALDLLSPKERGIVEMAFGIDCRQLTVDEIASSSDIPKKTIQKILKQALEKMKEVIDLEALNPANYTDY